MIVGRIRQQHHGCQTIGRTWMILAVLTALQTLEVTTAAWTTFCGQKQSYSHCVGVREYFLNPYRLYAMGDSKSSRDEEQENNLGHTNDAMIHALRQRSEAIEVEGVRRQLEEANIKRFLKSRPVKLPYNDARRWVQANLGPDTKEEWYDLVANGNVRTPYIPKNPENYYTSTREWISWDHFLKGVFDDENPSAIRPVTGIFD